LTSYELEALKRCMAADKMELEVIASDKNTDEGQPVLQV
jgi:hypothetical protein